MGERDDSVAKPIPPESPPPRLQYSNLAVVLVRNPIALGGIFCGLLPIAMVGLMNTVDRLRRGPGIPADHAAIVLGWFGLLAIFLGIVGGWLSRDPKYMVAGRRLAMIAICLGAMETLGGVYLGFDAIRDTIVQWFTTLPARRSTAPACRANLQQIYRAMVAYADKHNGDLPGNLDMMQPPLLCPAENKPYVLVSQGLNRKTIAPHTIIAYEEMTAHEELANTGRFVLFADGTIEWWYGDRARDLPPNLSMGENPPAP